MREAGVVDAIEGGEVLVRLKRHSACLGCRACSMGTGGDMIIKAVAGDGVKIGDQVAVEIDSISIVKAIIMVYLLPTTAFLGGILAGLKIAPQLGLYEHKEIFSILTGIALLCASLLLAREYGIKKKDAYKARITEAIDGGAE